MCPLIYSSRRLDDVDVVLVLVLAATEFFVIVSEGDYIRRARQLNIYIYNSFFRRTLNKVPGDLTAIRILLFCCFVFAVVVSKALLSSVDGGLALILAGRVNTKCRLLYSSR